VSFGGAVLEIDGGECERLLDVLRLQFGVVPKEVIPIGYRATASTTLRTVRRIPRTHGCPFIWLGFHVIRSKRCIQFNSHTFPWARGLDRGRQQFRGMKKPS